MIFKDTERQVAVTEREKDDFWAIDKLIPKKEKPKYSRPAADTSATEIVISPPTEKDKSSSELTLPNVYPIQKPSAPASAPSVDCEYAPVSPLINSVRIYRWKNNYNYYEEFRRDALRLRDVKGSPATPVPFFSYVPQYVQLDREQLAWYLYFRECVKNGEFPEVDYSYIILLIYEIINLGDLTDLSEGQKTLCELHKHYRREFPRLDRYLGEWVCDYSLIHRLPPPDAAVYPGLADGSTLREFYVYTEDPEAPDYYARLLIKFCSGYDYRKSKFASGDNLPLYEKHVGAALSRVIAECSDSGGFLSGAGLETNSLTRDAYSGALCASEMKRRIEVDFCSFSRSHELRFLVADIIKYSENKIRAYLGIKSKLGVFGLPKDVQAALNRYFDENLQTVRRVSAASEITENEYEKLYDLPHTELSLENAANIEAESWKVTKKLVETFETDIPEPVSEQVQEPEPQSIAQKGDETDDPVSALRAVLGEKYEFVLAAVDDDLTRQLQTAKKLGIPPDLLADLINETAADIFGDVILEESGAGFTIIEDYKEIFR